MADVRQFVEGADEWLGWADRWPLLIPVFFAIGVCCYLGLNDEPSALITFALAALLSGALLMARLMFHARVWPVLLFAVASGFVAGTSQTERAEGRTILMEMVGPERISGRIIGIEDTGSFRRVRLSDVGIDGVLRSVRLRLKGDDDQLLEIGDRVAVTAFVFPPPGPALPGTYDFRRRAFFDRLDGTGVALGAVEILDASGLEGGGRDPLAMWRIATAERIMTVLDAPSGPIAITLLTGDRSRMAPDVYDTLRDAGLAHLLAISGLHVGLVAGFVFSFLRLLFSLWPYGADRWDSKKIAAVGAIIGALGYTIAVGATVPTQRAFVMTSLAFLAILLDRWPISMRLVAIAAMIVMLLAPVVVIEPGFQMSFAAVIALIAVYEAITKDGVRRLGAGALGVDSAGSLYRIINYVGGVLLTSVIAGAATAPFAIYHFQHLATYGLVSNLVAVPLTAFWIMPAGMIAIAAMPFSADAIPLTVMGYGIDLLLVVAEKAADWPGAALTVPQPSIGILVLFVASGLWLAIFRGPGRLFGVGPMVLALLLIAATPPAVAFVDGRDGTIGVMLAGMADSDGASHTVRQERVLWLSDSRLSDYATNLWVRAGLADRTQVFSANNHFGGIPHTAGVEPSAADRSAGTIRCDGEGCVAHVRIRTRGGTATIAIPRTRYALVEDCVLADIIITTLDVPTTPKGCEGTTIIDRTFVEDRGGVTISDRGSGWTIQTVRDAIGNRPWSSWYAVSPAERTARLP